MTNKIKSIVQDEPVAVGGSITTLVTATLSVLTAFDVIHFTDSQTSSVLGLVSLLVIGITGLQRSKVKPV